VAQVWTTKQQNFVLRFSNQAMALMAAADALGVLCGEFADNQYGQGGANQIPDATVQLVLPASTSLQVAQAVGALDGANQILSVISANRGYLENMRP
jgi:hypothetical protein